MSSETGVIHIGRVKELQFEKGLSRKRELRGVGQTS